MASNTFRSLRHPNARLFFAGMAMSNVGTWAQFTAVALLVDELTGRTTAIGVLAALEFLPMLLLGAWGGAISDRVDRLKMVRITQSVMAAQAITLAACAIADVVTVPLIYVLTLVLGTAAAFDNPARRAFVTELVPNEQITNAISLNTAVMTGSRIFGPALTAVLLGPLGAAGLFVINAISFVGILGSLFLIRRAQLFRAPRAPRGGTPVRDGLRLVRRNEVLLATFIAFAVWSTFGFNYSVSLPRIADVEWGDSSWFGWVLTTISIGSLCGSLITASRTWVSLRWLIGNSTLMGAGLLGVAVAPNPWAAMVISIPLGVGAAGVVSSFNAITQQECPPDMRGRILALGAVAFLGSTPIGGPITGLVGDEIGLGWSLAYGGLICLAATAGLTWWALGRRPTQSRIATLRSLLGTSVPVAPAAEER